MSAITDLKRDAEKRGFITAPGFIDLHAHLREPGFEESETIADGARAALRGGFTTVCCMPNTEPSLDNAGLLEEVRERGAAAKSARILPIASITRGRKGEVLSDLVELARAGAVAFSDDGAPLQDARLMRFALEYARATGRVVSDHAQDAVLASAGVMHEGSVSADLGLPGISAAAEETAVARDLLLAGLTRGRLHLTHVTTAGSVELIRAAKARGISVTCDVTPHHLAMTDTWVAGDRTLAFDRPSDLADAQADSNAHRASPFDSATKVNPPLRPRGDVDALWAGLRDGTIDAIATDHAPHASVYKDVVYDQAAFGISGLETALPLLLAAVEAGWLELPTLVERLTLGPARCFGLDAPDLGRDIVLIDPHAEWRVTADALASRGKNTPLLGRLIRGRVVVAFVDGEQRLG